MKTTEFLPKIIIELQVKMNEFQVKMIEVQVKIIEVQVKIMGNSSYNSLNSN